jgi:hypothetical protein
LTACRRPDRFPPFQGRVQSVEWFLVTLSIYRRVFVRAAALAGKNWPVLGTVFVYSAIMTVAVSVVIMLGMIGGFVFSLVWAACVGSFLYLVEMIVRTSKVTLADFRRSFGIYLWDVVGISFLSWVFFTLATPAIMQLPQGGLILRFAWIVILVLFNAVPELIYLGHYSALALLSESYAFISANWIEWFPANLAAAAMLYLVWSVPIEGPAIYAQRALLGLLVYFLMVMRGLLFIELQGSTHRGRAFKYRMGA